MNNDHNETARTAIEAVMAYKPTSGPRMLDGVRNGLVYAIEHPEASYAEIGAMFHVDGRAIASAVQRLRNHAQINFPPRANAKASNVENMVRENNHGMAKYAPDLRERIKSARAAGASLNEVARAFGVSYSTVRRVAAEPSRAAEYRADRAEATEPYGQPHA